MRIDPNDDLATAQPPFRVIAVIPVLGRGPLLKLTIERLLHKNGCDKVICVGHKEEDKEICLAAGAFWVYHDNKPLGAKWNAGFHKAKQFNPDACLYVGSSDWLCDQWLTLMKPHLDLHQMVGVPGMHLLDFGKTMRVCKWDGYTGPRSDESIGIGRMLSRSVLNKLDWTPFDPLKDNSLDRSMKDRARALGFADVMIYDNRLIACSISTDKWINKHIFEAHWDGRMPSTRIEDVPTFINNYFPEANTLCESLKATSVKV